MARFQLLLCWAILLMSATMGAAYEDDESDGCVLPEDIEIKAYIEKSEMSEVLGVDFIAVLEEASQREGIISIAISGGSLPKLLEAGLSSEALSEAKIDWDRVHLFFADERFVQYDHPDSNWAEIKKRLRIVVTLLKRDNIHLIDVSDGVRMAAINYQNDMRNVFGLEEPKPPTWGSASDHEVAAGLEFFEDPDLRGEQINGWLLDESEIGGELSPEDRQLLNIALAQQAEWRASIPQFDVILLGMGEDGHTASIFPDHVLADTHIHKLIAPIADSPKPPSKRITMTIPLINNARNIFFVCTGAAKGIAFEAVMRTHASEAAESDRMTSHEHPAGMVYPHDGQMNWYVDAASSFVWDDGCIPPDSAHAEL